MSYHTGNTVVVKALQKALEDFLADQRKSAMQHDPEWAEEWKKKSDEEKKEFSGCGCEDCTIAGQLLANIY